MQLLLRIGIGRMTWIHALAVLLLILMAAPLVKAAEGKRVAFVVGISKYDNLADDKQLKNAVNDAEGVSKRLGEIGFKVVPVINPRRSEFNGQWHDTLKMLGPEDTFVLYYSGHGVQIRGQNYLLPRDVPPIRYDRRELLEDESIRLNKLLDDLSAEEQPHPKYSVVILDACRDDPFVPPEYKKSINRSTGLTRVESPRGTFVLYSAASNRTALDRLGSSDPVKYSVFTRALLPLIGRRDLSIQELTSELKEEVYRLARSAGHEQVPAYYENILGRFCLAGCAAKAERELAGLKENLTTTVVRPSSTKEIRSGTKDDSPPAPLSPEPTQQPAMQQNARIAQVQPTEELPLAITGKDGALMVLVPAGGFWMGSPGGEGTADEHPQHHVYLDAFYLDQYEVTTTRYATFIHETKRPLPKYWPEQVLNRHGRKPVVGVNWNDATAYCSWAGKRLPTEAEWEKSARGTGQRPYPWGSASPRHVLANFHNCCDFKDYGALTNVGSKQGKSPYGAHDLAGNVWEWVADWYDETYYGRSQEANPTGSSSGKDRVIRGGSWIDDEAYLRSANRYYVTPSSDGSNWIGFRCAQATK